MPRSYALTFGSFVLVLAVSGCGESDSFMPPPRPDLLGPTSESPVTVVEMIVPVERTPDRQALSHLLRVLASQEKTSFRFAAPEPNDPPQRQAELIRKAAERGATVLIVDPAQDAEVAKALAEVRKGGVPSLLLAQLDPKPEPPYPVVEHSPYGETAGKLVEAAVEDAKAAKAPADATAAVLTVREPSADAKDSLAAFEAALKKAAVPHGEPITFDGTPEGAKTALNERLESDPKLAIVLIGDDVGFHSALEVRSKLEGKRPIIVAGYVRENSLLTETTYSQTAAIAIRNLPDLAREALKVARLLADRSTVPDQTVVPDEFRRYDSKYVAVPAPPTDPRLGPAEPPSPE